MCSTLVAAFACCAIPAVIWTALHPGMLGDTLIIITSPAAVAAIERITLFWDYFNPSYLFFSGALELVVVHEDRRRLPAVVPRSVAGGLWALAYAWRSTFDGVCCWRFFLVPLPIVLAMPEAPFYATPRAILAAPFGVLIATAGVAVLARNQLPVDASPGAHRHRADALAIRVVCARLFHRLSAAVGSLDRHHEFPGSGTVCHRQCQQYSRRCS